MIEVPRIEPPENPSFRQRVITFAEFIRGQRHAIPAQELEEAAGKAVMAKELAKAYSTGLAKQGLPTESVRELIAAAEEEAKFTGIYRTRITQAGRIERGLAVEFEPVALAGLAATMSYNRFLLSYRSQRGKVETLETPAINVNPSGLSFVERPARPRDLTRLDPHKHVNGYFVTPEYSEASRLSPNSRIGRQIRILAFRQYGIEER